MRKSFDGLKPRYLLARLERALTAVAVSLPNPGIPTLLSPKARRRAFRPSHWKAGAMAGAALLTMASGVQSVGVSAFDQGAAICLNGTINGTVDPPATAPAGCAAPTVYWAPSLFTAGTGGDITYSGAPHQPPAVAGFTPIADFGAPDYAKPDCSNNTVCDRTYFGSSNKDTQDSSTWQCTTISNPANKQDLQNAYAAVYKNNTSGHRFLYVASERYDNSGDAFQGFWFMKNSASCTGPVTPGGASLNFSSAGHSPDDLLILANYTQGGVIAGINIYKWDTTCTTQNVVQQNPGVGDCAAVNLRVVVAESNNPTCGTANGTADVACGITNSDTITPPWNISPALSTAHLVPNTFLELGVDLDAPGLSGNVPCGTSFLAESRESQSPTAALKDYVGGALDLCAPTTTTTQLQEQVGSTWTNLGGNPAAVLVGTVVRDTATITPAPPSTDSVTFKLYNGSGCDSTTGLPTGSLVTSFGTGGSDPELYTGANTPSMAASGLAPGTYQFQATFASDLSNLIEGSMSACGSEVFTVGKASPTISTTAGASTSGAVGSLMSISDTANLTGFINLVSGDQMTFNLYGPTGPGTFVCDSTDKVAGPFTEPIDTSTGSATTSQSFTPVATGTYYWVASFPGDANNNGPVTEACGNSGEAVTVNAVQPTLATNASTLDGAATSGIVGQTISVGDTGTLSGFSNLLSGDTMTFALYGPTSASSPSCTSADKVLPASGTYSGTVDQVTGVADSQLHDFTPTAPGTYYWVATFSGDSNNGPVANGVGCGDSAEAVVISPASPAISTAPSATAPVQTPGNVSDTATVTGGFQPTGTVTFALYGPFTSAPAATDCAGATNLVAGMSSFANVPLTNGQATSPAYPVTKSGTYQWVATYNGDPNNNTALGLCGDTTEQFTAFTVTVQAAATPAKTGDFSIFMLLGIPLVLIGSLLLFLGRKRQEGEA